MKKPGNNGCLSLSLNSVNVPVIVWNREQKVVALNKSFEEMSSRSDMEIVGQSMDVLFPEESRFDLSQKIESASRGEECKGGTIRMGLWNFSRICIGDISESFVIIGAGQDITARKKIEEHVPPYL